MRGETLAILLCSALRAQGRRPRVGFCLDPVTGWWNLEVKCKDIVVARLPCGPMVGATPEFLDVLARGIEAVSALDGDGKLLVDPSLCTRKKAGWKSAIDRGNDGVLFIPCPECGTIHR